MRCSIASVGEFELLLSGPYRDRKVFVAIVLGAFSLSLIGIGIVLVLSMGVGLAVLLCAVVQGREGTVTSGHCRFPRNRVSDAHLKKNPALRISPARGSDLNRAVTMDGNLTVGVGECDRPVPPRTLHR